MTLQIALVSELEPDKRRKLLDIEPRLEFLEFHNGRDGLIVRGKDVEIVHGNVRPHELPHLKKLRWVHALWTGVENLLYPEMVASDVIITNTRGQARLPMSEHALAGLLYLVRDFPVWSAASANRQWQVKYHATHLRNSTVLILGAGAIAAELIPMLNALGARVWGVNSDGSPRKGCERCFTMQTVREHLGEVDHVVMLLPASAHTQHAMDRDFMQALKPGAGVVNLSRGSVIDPVALKELVDSGHLRGAVLDVTDPEPPPPDYPLFGHPRILLTGHSSFFPHPPGEAVSFDIFTHNLRCYLGNRLSDMRNVVNKHAGY